jgi:hypothetical protein
MNKIKVYQSGQLIEELDGSYLRDGYIEAVDEDDEGSDND